MKITMCFNEGGQRLQGLAEGVHVGGSHMLKLFLREVSRARTGRLWLVSPFLTPKIVIAQHGALAAASTALRELHVITASREAASEVGMLLREWKWKNLSISWHPRLHAKVYLLVGDGNRSLAMFGSHNLTEGGVNRNLEMGVLLSSTGAGEVRHAIHACEAEMRRLERRSQVR